MDYTYEVFPLLESYLTQIKQLKKESKTKKDLLREYTQYIISQIQSSMQAGYTLRIDDLAEYLDLEEAYVRRTLLPYLDYIVLPAGAAEAFTAQQMPHLSFMALRLYKWKKILISKVSFETFLERYLWIQAPYQNIRWDPEKVCYVPCTNKSGKEEILYQDIPYKKAYELEFIRKSNYIEYVSEKKTEAFYRKTKGDIVYAYEQKWIDKQRLKQEMELLSEAKNKHRLVMTAYQNEVERYAFLEGRVKIKLSLDIEKSNKKNDVILYSKLATEIDLVRDFF